MDEAPPNISDKIVIGLFSLIGLFVTGWIFWHLWPIAVVFWAFVAYSMWQHREKPQAVASTVQSEPVTTVAPPKPVPVAPPKSVDALPRVLAVQQRPRETKSQTLQHGPLVPRKPIRQDTDAYGRVEPR